jgi:RNA-binding protein
MKGKERANLRAEAHHLNPIVHVGHAGITEAVIQTTDEALRTRELIKIDISRNLEMSPKEAAAALASATQAEVIQVIGRKVTLYRENPELEWKDGVPPWR